MHLLTHDGEIFTPQRQQHVELKLRDFLVILLRSFILFNESVLLLDLGPDLVTQLHLVLHHVESATYADVLSWLFRFLPAAHAFIIADLLVRNTSFKVDSVRWDGRLY